jgi:phenylalanyl-tRNA synthetase alpha chain
MTDLAPYRPVSRYPAIRRDLSIAVDVGLTPEGLGDQVRVALGPDATSIEEIRVVAETALDDLPPAAIARLGIRPGQKNVLLRLVVRDLDRTLTHADANALRDRVYLALHRGDARELTGAP